MEMHAAKIQDIVYGFDGPVRGKNLKRDQVL